VIGDVPANSHLQFQSLIPLSSIENERMRSNWGGNWVRTYILLHENAPFEQLESKLTAFCAKYIPTEYSKYYQLYLQPLSGIHLGSTHINHDLNWRKIDERYVLFLLAIAIAVICIATTNNVNLYIASANQRIKEIGIKKVLGVLPRQI
jgi:putative ABC transport system permease protein